MRTLFVTLCSLALAFPAAAAETSRPSPAFSVLLAGNPAPPPIQISQYKGKVVMLAFIATTCPHCQDLTQKLKPIAQEYAPRGVQVIECAFNDDAEHLVTAFIQQFQPGFPVGWNNRMAVMNYLQWSILDTRPLYVPHLVFLDKQGVIRDDIPGGDPFFTNLESSIRAEFDKLLKAGGATKTVSHKK